MSSNKLYNFVHTVVFKNDNQSVDKATLFQQTHLNGTPYYLLQLSKKSNAFPDGLTLIEHHISIYKEPVSTVDKKSEYHYTAIFKDKQKKTYRLHVYFDQFNEMVTPPHLDLDTGNQQYESIKTDELDVDWFALSHKMSDSVITQLRKEQNQQCTLLKNKIEPLEKKTTQLSTDLTKNKKLYLNTLSQQIELGIQLDAINSKEDKQKEIEFLQQMHQKVSSEITVAYKKTKKSKNEPSSSVSSVPAIIMGDSNEKKTSTSLKKQKAASKNTKDKLTQLHQEFMQEMKRSADALLTIETIGNESEKGVLIRNIYKQIEGLQLTTPPSLPNDSIQALNKMQQRITTIARKHIHYLLSKNKWDEALALSSLFSVALDDAIFNQALRQLNPVLIDFLLENGNYDLDRFKPKINKKDYSSIMEFLFQCDLKSSNVVRCFDVLLTYKMSLLRKNSDGIPCLFRLIEDAEQLIDATHPMVQALIKNLKKSPKNICGLRGVIEYFKTQNNNFTHDIKLHARMMTATIKLYSLFMNLNIEMDLSAEMNFAESIDILVQADTLMKQSNALETQASTSVSDTDSVTDQFTTTSTSATGSLPEQFTTASASDTDSVTTCSPEKTGQVPLNFQRGDIYGGFGIFKLSEYSIESTQDEVPEKTLMRKNNK
ncbi:hypothetical protein [Legionella fallonii]|uniref:Coiled-coil-containing protein n=1 Tax=Legionella fallonii LLAP-10 TaxID=1212491 RepID=A0A098G7F9_9GAMM|nr:hypothetical protein [Legionella fallonii]CEG57904.1 protein of unknown function [Legionella fallonii LLAP-10]